ncbi:hypothetical protein PMAYCL1PPCAC_14512, partial [Pristionchus mayeri]
HMGALDGRNYHKGAVSRFRPLDHDANRSAHLRDQSRQIGRNDNSPTPPPSSTPGTTATLLFSRIRGVHYAPYYGAALRNRTRLTRFLYQTFGDHNQDEFATPIADSLP